MRSLLAITIALASTVATLFAEFAIPAARTIDWDAGIPTGIPAWSGWTTRNVVTDEGAVGDGVTDDTAAILSAITWAEANDPQVKIYFPAGTYKVTSELEIDGGDQIVMYGDGVGSSTIEFHGTSDRGIRFDATGTASAVSVSSGYTKGSTTVTVADGSSYAAGDLVWLSQTQDTAVVEWGSTPDEGGAYPIASGGNARLRAQGQMLEVASRSGNDITFQSPLYYGYNAGEAVELVEYTSPSKYCGIEDLTITRKVNNGTDNIIIFRSMYCWVKDVESFDAKNHHVHIQSSLGCEVRECYLKAAQAYTGSVPYGVYLNQHTSDTLIEDNIMYYLHHSMVAGNGATGNVFGYNYSHRMYSLDPDTEPQAQGLDMLCHGGHTNMNLFEGNIGVKMFADYTWGSNRHNTYFRNHSEGYGVTGSGALQPNTRETLVFERASLDHNVLGNVLGRSGHTQDYDLSGDDHGSGEGDDSRVGKSDAGGTTLWHGNYNYVTPGVEWDSGEADHDLADSLYLVAKPSFFAAADPWPLIGPDVASPYVGTLPAKQRYVNLYLPAESTDNFVDHWSQYPQNDATATSATAGSITIE